MKRKFFALTLAIIAVIGCLFMGFSCGGYLSVDNSREDFTKHVFSDPSSFKVNVDTNLNLSVQSDVPWLTISCIENKNEVIIEYSQNNTKSSRTGAVTFKAGDYTIKGTVIQSPSSNY